MLGTFVKSKPPVRAQLSECTSLQELVLSSTTVGDEGLAHLSQLSRLRELCMCRSAVTHKGIAHLAPLRKLEIITCDLNEEKRLALQLVGLDHIARDPVLELL